MVSGFTDFTTTTFPASCQILKVSVPKGVYSDKEMKKLYNDIKGQVGNCYLPVIVPDDVNLETIV